MAERGKSKPRRGAPIDEERLHAEINHSFGLEKRTVHVRGRRAAVSRVFHKPNGDIDVGITLAQSIFDTKFPSDKYSDLYKSAEDYLCLNKEDYKSFEAKLQHIDFERSEKEKHKLLYMLWYSSVTEKHGAVSPQAIAARFLYISDSVVKLKLLSAEEFETIFAFGEAWHHWQSELDGEHLAATLAERAQSNLQKAGPARSQRKGLKLDIVRNRAEQYWHDFPKFRGNASRTAAAIHDNVNADLQGIGEKPYTSGSLEKAIGSIVPPRPGKKN